MPLDGTWRHLRRLCRLTPDEERYLRALCAGATPGQIAEGHGRETAEVAKVIKTTQRRCRDARPWLRMPTWWEEERDREEWEARCRVAEALGRLKPGWAATPRDVDDDLRRDAALVLRVWRRGRDRPPSEVLIPHAAPVVAEDLVRWWTRCLTGGTHERPPGMPVVEWVINTLRKGSRARGRTRKVRKVRR